MFYIIATHRFATFRNFFACEALCRELCVRVESSVANLPRVCVAILRRVCVAISPRVCVTEFTGAVVAVAGVVSSGHRGRGSSFERSPRYFERSPFVIFVCSVCSVCYMRRKRHPNIG